MTIRFAQASTTVLGLLILTSCSLVSSVTSSPENTANTVVKVDSNPAEPASAATPLWVGESLSDDWMTDWDVRSEKSWGLDNLEAIAEADGRFEQIWRVRYPAGSASPSVSRRDGVALGGAQFYAELDLPPQNQLRLSYFVRFSENFDFVKGGKLPGLFGGDGASGGTIPDGTDGFSTRFMWRRQGAGEVYAYLPTSEDYGTSIGRGTWQFQPGVWYQLEQVVSLNQPDRADGQIQVWVNGNLVLEQRDIRFRTVDSLQIDGIFFSTFFGGGDASWATPQDVYIDFANFSVSAVE
ncbi:MAG: polysaccharide lyase [Elainellaceae cyanobacterium]